MELAVLVPECQSDGVRANKGIVLKLTADYLRQVLAEKEELAARAARLEEELAKARQT